MSLCWRGGRRENMSEFIARQVLRFFRAWGTFLNCVVLSFSELTESLAKTSWIWRNIDLFTTKATCDFIYNFPYFHENLNFNVAWVLDFLFKKYSIIQHLREAGKKYENLNAGGNLHKTFSVTSAYTGLRTPFSALHWYVPACCLPTCSNVNKAPSLSGIEECSEIVWNCMNFNFNLPFYSEFFHDFN